ncbi:MAG: glycosyltransferase family 4 protein [Lachnospiraceae bacterium]
MSKSLNVLQIINYAAPYKGNFIPSIQFLGENHIATDGTMVLLFAPHIKGSDAIGWIDELIEKKYKIYFMTGSIFHDTRLIHKICREYEINIIHAHFMKMKMLIPVFLGKTRKCMQILHYHNHSEEYQDVIKKSIRRAIYKKMLMIACSESVYQSVVRDFPKNRSYVVNNGVDFHRLKQSEPLERCDTEVSKCLMFGFDYERKGVDVAIEAIGLARKQLNVELYIALSKNKEIVESKIVEALGEIPNWLHLIKAQSDVATLYNSMDIFLSPSREEGLPYSVIEASYCRPITIVSDIKAQRYLELPYNYTFESEKPEKLASIILEKAHMVEGKAQRKEMIREDIEERYSLEKWANKISNVYKECLYK